MSVLLLQLSDIHITATHDPVVDRADSLAKAVRPLLTEADAVVVVVSGDLAYSGRPDQLAIGVDLIERVRAGLNGTGHTRPPVVIVPGNHDCQFPKDDTARNIMLDSVRRENAAAPSMHDAVLGVQDAFFDALQPYLPRAVPADSRTARLYYEYDLQAGPHRVLFRCYNTAWTSRLHERPGQMRYFAASPQTTATNHDLVVSVLHHPPHWLAPADVRAMREHWLTTADLVLTGHEHEPAQTRTVDLDGGAFTHLEGGVLQDSDDDDQSSFNVVLLDPIGRRSRTIRFKWDGARYTRESASQGEWAPFHRNAKLKGSLFSPTEAFRDRLEDPGATFTSSSKGRLTLSDLFVMPEVAVLDAGDLATQETASGPVELVTSCARVAFSGEERSGKSALAKRLVPPLLLQGAVPVLIHGADLKGGDPGRAVTRAVERAVEAQYGSDAVEPFRQADPDSRVLLIDDFEESATSATARQRLLRAFDDAGYEHVALFVGTTSSVLDLVMQADGDHDAAAPYVLAQIQPFGHVLRDRLIERWFSVQDSELTDAERLRKINSAHRTINGVLGNNFVPAYPIFILSILQGIEAHTPLDTRATTYGYFYEILIYEALGAHQKRDASLVGTLLALLGFMARRIHVTGVKLLSDDEIQAVHGDYKTWANMNDRDIPLGPALERLTRARLLERTPAGDLRFTYPYVYYYSAARYYSDKIGTDSDARAEVEALCEKLYEEEAANILLFLAHLSKDPFVIQNILRSARSVFPDIPPADLRNPLPLFDGLESDVRSVVDDLDPTYAEVSPDSARKEALAHRDTAEEEVGQTRPTGDDAGWREGIDLTVRVNVALKAVQILGQILKNSPGDIPGDVKRELADECYSLGLRSVQAFYDFLDKERAELIEGIVGLVKARHRRLHDGSEIGDRDLIDKARKSVVALSITFSYVVVRHIAQAVGIPRGLNATYQDILATAQGNPNYTLIDASIRLDHTTGFPQGDIERIGGELKPHFIASSILRRMVVNHFYLFEVDRKVREEVCSKLGIQVEPGKVLDTKRKRVLKGKR